MFCIVSKQSGRGGKLVAAAAVRGVICAGDFVDLSCCKSSISLGTEAECHLSTAKSGRLTGCDGGHHNARCWSQELRRLQDGENLATTCGRAMVLISPSCLAKAWNGDPFDMTYSVVAARNLISP